MYIYIERERELTRPPSPQGASRGRLPSYVSRRIYLSASIYCYIYLSIYVYMYIYIQIDIYIYGERDNPFPPLPGCLSRPAPLLRLP